MLGFSFFLEVSHPSLCKIVLFDIKYCNFVSSNPCEDENGLENGVTAHEQGFVNIITGTYASSDQEADDEVKQGSCG